MLARLLSRKSIPCTIFESEKSINYRSQGGTLDLRERTGLATVKEAGIYDEFLKLARFDGEYLLVCDKKLTTWMTRSASKQGDKNKLMDAPEIDRVVLRKMLMESLPEGIVRWGYKLRRVEPDLSLHFDNGEVESGFDLIVGADGAWSKVRDFLSPEKPFYSGIGGYSMSITDAEKKAPKAYAFCNRGSVFAYSDFKNINGQQIGDGSLNVSVYDKRDENWMKAPDFRPGDITAAKKSLLEKYHDWHPDLLNLIESSDSEVQARNLYMLPVGFRTEHQRGVTLLGDAAHLMTPYAGIGVNMAFFDAMLLANAISDSMRSGDSDSLDAHIINYEEKMWKNAKESQELTYDTMKDMLLTPGAPRTVVESWMLRFVRLEFPAWAMLFITPAVYIGFFFYKLFV